MIYKMLFRYFRFSCAPVPCAAIGALVAAPVANAQTVVQGNPLAVPGMQSNVVPLGAVPVMRQQGAAVAPGKMTGVGGQKSFQHGSDRQKPRRARQ